MFKDIEMNDWKKVFHFQNTKETMLRLKYSNRWFFPLMLSMTIVLLFAFLLFVIFFFLMEHTIVSGTTYALSVLIFILCWAGIFFAIQRKAVSPYSSKTNGYLVFTEKQLIVKMILKNSVKECTYQYNDVGRICFNRATCGLAIIGRDKKIIFNEIIPFESVSEILNILFEQTKIKPEII